jgi:predicted nucleotidyltransferase
MVTAEEAIRTVLSTEPSVCLAVLFGSAARKELRSSSDLDIGVLGSERGVLSALEGALSRVAGRRVELVALDTAPPLLRFEIARDGRVLLERTPHAWSDFKARAMVDWWDWAPIARRFHRAAAARLREGHGPA